MNLGVILRDAREGRFIKGRRWFPPPLITFPRLSVDKFADQLQNGNQRLCKRDYSPESND